MRYRVIDFLGWVLFTIMAASLVVVSFRWSASRAEEMTLARTLSLALVRLEERIAVSNSRWQALLEKLGTDQGVLRNLLGTHLIDQHDSHSAGSNTNATVKLTPSVEDIKGEDLSALPAIPAGVQPSGVVAMDLMEILSDPRLNPQGKKMTYVEASKARVELARAKGMLSVLDSEIILEFNQAMDILRPEGAYFEYKSGEKYENVKGVMTSGEIMPGGGVRMFYFYPERFPGIYEKKQRKLEIAEASTRRILSMLSE